VEQTVTGPDRIAAELAADLDAGFAALFEAHQNVLFSTALRICGRWADAEDLTASAFLRAYRALSGYDRERIARLRTRFGTPRKEALLRLEGTNLDEVRDLAAAGTRYLASDTTGVVCFPSCRNARRITPAHRRGFASLAAAGRAGFRPCLHCQPA
jgi:hypothetical protein